MSGFINSTKLPTLTKNVIFIFVEEVMQSTYCEIELDKAKRDAFVYAIKNHYWYQMYIDDLPIWGKLITTFYFINTSTFTCFFCFVS